MCLQSTLKWIHFLARSARENRNLNTRQCKINRLSECSFLHDKDINSGADGVSTGRKGYVNKPVHFLSSDVGVFPTCTIKGWDQNKKNCSVPLCCNVL